MAAPGFVEPRVVGLAHHGDRNHLVVTPCMRDGLEHGVDDRIEHSPDRGGAGQHDRRLERPPLGHRDRAGELATAIQHGVARGHRPFPEGANLVGHDRRHSRAGDAVGFVLPDRDVADGHARNVGDGVVLAGGQRAERQPELRRGRGRGDGGGMRRVCPVGTTGAVSIYRRAMPGGGGMPVVWSDRHRGHRPNGGYWLGIREQGDEEPERGDVLRAGLQSAGYEIVTPPDLGLEPITAVHDAEYVEFLRARYPVTGRRRTPRRARAARRSSPTSSPPRRSPAVTPWAGGRRRSVPSSGSTRWTR